MNQETIQAIKDSIEHWEKDIVKPLKECLEIFSKIDREKNRYRLYWKHMFRTFFDRKVKCYAPDCQLCKIFKCGEDSYNTPLECPLQKVDECCLNRESVYYNFIDNPCLETAEAMIEALESLLPEEER